VEPCGYRAIESLRLEEGYCAWDAESNPDRTPLEAGLGWALKLGGNMSFVSREALACQREDGLTPARLLYRRP
jgi:sarcosine dehydrogenase